MRTRIGITHCTVMWDHTMTIKTTDIPNIFIYAVVEPFALALRALCGDGFTGTLGIVNPSCNLYCDTSLFVTL